MSMLRIDGVNFKTKTMADAYKRIEIQCSGSSCGGWGVLPLREVALRGESLSGSVSVMALTGSDIEKGEDNVRLPLMIDARSILRRSDDWSVLTFDANQLAGPFNVLRKHFLPGLTVNPESRTFMVKAFSPTLDFWIRYLNTGDEIDYLFISGRLGAGRDCPARIFDTPVKFHNMIPFAEEERAPFLFRSEKGYGLSSDLFLFPRDKGSPSAHFHFSIRAQKEGRFLELAAKRPDNGSGAGPP